MSGNPVLPGWYADPEIHIFAGRFYIYPTYSAPYEEQTFFEVWSSEDLTDWRKDGIALDFADVPWSTNRAAWAPTVGRMGGRYYMYFSAGDGAGIGVAVADHPAGPFKDALGRPLISEYHHGAQPIDAHVFLDGDGTNYLYWGGWRKAVVAKLSDDMLSIEGDILEITPEGYVEGPFMVQRGETYYFMWSEGNWTDSTYRVAYGTSTSPLGPFPRKGAILGSEAGIADGAGHHSVVRLMGTDEYLICYHRRILGDTNPHHRVTCLETLTFAEDGSILPIRLTAEGVPAQPATVMLTEAQRQEAETAMTALIGQPLTDMWRYMGFQRLEFGEQKPAKNRKGEDITRSDWGLVLGGYWQIASADGFTLSDAHFGPDKERRDDHADGLYNRLSENPLQVLSIELALNGNLRVELTDRFTLSANTVDFSDWLNEYWRFDAPGMGCSLDSQHGYYAYSKSDDPT